MTPTELFDFLMALVAILVAYFALAFLCWRLGRRFRDEGFWMYCIPVYGFILLCRCAGVSAWHTLAPCAWLLLSGVFQSEALSGVLFLAFIGAITWVFGNIARRLGKSFWKYGLGTATIGFPVLILAFGDGVAVAERTPDASPDFVPDLEPFGPDTRDRSLKLRCVAGDGVGSEYLLSPDAPLIIGRDPRAVNVVLANTQVGGVHVSVRSVQTALGRVAEVVDFGSVNGTYIWRAKDQQWRRATERATIEVGDRIRIADDAAEFQLA